MIPVLGTGDQEDLPWLHSECKANLGYIMKPHLPPKKTLRRGRENHKGSSGFPPPQFQEGLSCFSVTYENKGEEGRGHPSLANTDSGKLGMACVPVTGEVEAGGF